MYAPLRFMNQVESMVSVNGHPKLRARANTSLLNAAESFWDNNRNERFVKSCIEWERLRYEMNKPVRYTRDVESYKDYFVNSTGLVYENTADFLYHLHMYLIRKEWSKNKRVYKIDKEMSRQLVEMRVPKEIPMRALAFLPSKCFYIDYDGACPFCEDVAGTFVTYDIYKNIISWRLTHIFDRKRLLCSYTDFSVLIEYAMMEHLEDVVAPVDTSGFNEEMCTVVLEDNHKVQMSEGKCLNFFINLCLYMFSANNDVEYTERTKQIYKKTETIKNTLKEVEEFGVGFRNGRKISKSKKKVRYIATGDRVVADVKRCYSSNYRSAHWHHYWINDPDNPNKKKLILKWVEGTFVRGNIDNNPVVVQRVTK